MVQAADGLMTEVASPEHVMKIGECKKSPVSASVVQNRQISCFGWAIMANRIESQRFGVVVTRMTVNPLTVASGKSLRCPSKP